MIAQRGQIWTVALSPTVANEQAGIRPCVVISANAYNAMPIGHAIVVPLTSRDRGLPHHVGVVDNGALQRPSWAMCEAVRAISVQRLGTLIGSADRATTDAIVRHVSAWIATDH